MIETATETAAATPTATLIETPTGTLTETTTPSPSPTVTETATQTAFPPEPPLTELFTDNFDSGALYLWTLGAGWALAESEGGLALQVTGSDEPVTFVHNTLTDVAAQARFQFETGTARLSVRENGADSYNVRLSVTGDVGLYRGEVLLGAAVVSPNQAGGWRTLRLSAIGDIVRVAIDGVEVIAIQDAAPLPQGTIAFAGIGASELRVDDIEISWLLSQDVLPENLQVIDTGSYSGEAPEASSSSLFSATSSESEIVEYIQYFDDRVPEPNQDTATYVISGTPATYVGPLNSSRFNYTPYTPSAWASAYGTEVSDVTLVVDLKLGSEPDTVYRVNGFSLVILFPVYPPTSEGLNQLRVEFKDPGGNVLRESSCQYVPSVSQCELSGAPPFTDGVSSITVTHQLIGSVNFGSDGEYHVGLDDFRISTTLSTELVEVRVQEVTTIVNETLETLPGGTKPIPYVDIVKLNLVITNTTGSPINAWELELFGIAPSGSSPSHGDGIPLKLRGQGDAVYSDSLQRLKWSGGVIPENESVTLVFEVSARRSGILKSTYTLSINGIVVRASQEIEVLTVDLTRLELDEGGVDSNLKAVMFWAIFNETSSGSFYSGTEQPFPNEPTNFVTFFNGSDYVGLYDLVGAYNEKIITYDTRSIDGSRFIAELDYCNDSTDGQDELEPPKVSWHPNITSVIHCEDFRYMEAQALINGFLNYERRLGMNAAFGFARKNFGGSLGTNNYDLWLDNDRCVERGFLNTIDAQGNIIARTYEDAVESRSDLDASGKILGWKPAIDWLNAYLNCQLKHVDPLRRLVFIMAYHRFMPQIERAIGDFYSKCDWQLLEFSTPNELLCDPTNGAFSLKQANIIIQETVTYTPPGEAEQSFLIDQEFGLRICAGGCTTEIFGTRDINGTRTLTFGQQPEFSIDDVSNDMIRDAYEDSSSPLPNCSKIFELNIFAGHREQLANCYGPGLPSILQPVLWTDRQSVDANNDNVIEDYQFSNYSWGSRVYQQAAPVDDAAHYPR